MQPVGPKNIHIAGYCDANRSVYIRSILWTTHSPSSCRIPCNVCHPSSQSPLALSIVHSVAHCTRSGAHILISWHPRINRRHIDHYWTIRYNVYLHYNTGCSWASLRNSFLTRYLLTANETWKKCQRNASTICMNYFYNMRASVIITAVVLHRH